MAVIPRRKPAAPPTTTPADAEKQMSFLGHLEEFRWHLIRSVLALIVALVVVMANLDWVMQRVILGPLQADFVTNRLLCQLNPALCVPGGIRVLLQATDPTEQFTKAILIGVVGALVLVFPYVAWEVWRFVRPGLYELELRRMRGIVGVVSLLFLSGVLFSYFVITPITLNFFATFQLAPSVQNIWRIGQVISLIAQITLGGGLLFQLPVLVYVLSRLGFLSPQIMRRYRRHAIVVILIVAGILTPDPTMFSQLILGVPMLLLYEGSIWISAREHRRRIREEQAAAAEDAKHRAAAATPALPQSERPATERPDADAQAPPPAEPES